MFMATIDGIATLMSIVFMIVLIALAFVGFGVILFTVLVRRECSVMDSVIDCFKASVSVLKKVLEF